MHIQTIMFPIEIMCENLHCIISASSSSITEVTLNLGVFFLYGSWGKRACSTKIYVKMEIFTISGFGSSRRMWLCSLIGVIRQPLASYMSQIWSWDFCKVTSMYLYVITKRGGGVRQWQFLIRYSTECNHKGGENSKSWLRNTWMVSSHCNV